jgi:hypothetical protein
LQVIVETSRKRRHGAVRVQGEEKERDRELEEGSNKKVKVLRYTLVGSGAPDGANERCDVTSVVGSGAPDGANAREEEEMPLVPGASGNERCRGAEGGTSEGRGVWAVAEMAAAVVGGGVAGTWRQDGGIRHVEDRPLGRDERLMRGYAQEVASRGCGGVEQRIGGRGQEDIGMGRVGGAVGGEGVSRQGAQGMESCDKMGTQGVLRQPSNGCRERRESSDKMGLDGDGKMRLDGDGKMRLDGDGARQGMQAGATHVQHADAVTWSRGMYGARASSAPGQSASRGMVGDATAGGCGSGGGVGGRGHDRVIDLEWVHDGAEGGEGGGWEGEGKGQKERREEGLGQDERPQCKLRRLVLVAPEGQDVQGRRERGEDGQGREGRERYQEQGRAVAGQARESGEKQREREVEAMRQFRLSLGRGVDGATSDATNATGVDAATSDATGDDDARPLAPLAAGTVGVYHAGVADVPEVISCGLAEPPQGQAAQYIYDWYTLGSGVEEEVRGMEGGREGYWGGGGRIGLLEYSDLVDSESGMEEQRQVLDEEFDSNAEMSDYPLTDPDSVGLRAHDEDAHEIHTGYSQGDSHLYSSSEGGGLGYGSFDRRHWRRSEGEARDRMGNGCWLADDSGGRGREDGWFVEGEGGREGERERDLRSRLFAHPNAYGRAGRDVFLPGRSWEHEERRVQEVKRRAQDKGLPRAPANGGDDAKGIADVENVAFPLCDQEEEEEEEEEESINWFHVPTDHGLSVPLNHLNPTLNLANLGP